MQVEKACTCLRSSFLNEVAKAVTLVLHDMFPERMVGTAPNGLRKHNVVIMDASEYPKINVQFFNIEKDRAMGLPKLYPDHVDNQFLLSQRRCWGYVSPPCIRRRERLHLVADHSRRVFDGYNMVLCYEYCFIVETSFSRHEVNHLMVGRKGV